MRNSRFDPHRFTAELGIKQSASLAWKMRELPSYLILEAMLKALSCQPRTYPKETGTEMGVKSGRPKLVVS